MCALLKKSELQGHPQTIRPFLEAEPGRAPQPETGRPPAASPPPVDERHQRLLERVVEEIVRERARLMTEIRPDVLLLTLAIAREIVGHEVRTDPAIIESTLTQALQNLHFASRIVVHLHPQDLAYLEDHPGPWQQQTAQLEFVGDPDVARGGCRLASDRGGIDATLETQLRTLHEALTIAYGESA